MASSNSMRRQITDLSEPLQIRELNRQLEWIWQQLLGGLTMKNMSNEGVDQVTELIIETTSEIYDPQIEDITEALDGKVSTSDVTTDLTITASGKVLDGRVGKTLSDSINGVSDRVTTLENALVYPKSIPT